MKNEPASEYPETPNEDSLVDEFEELGKNLILVLRAAWERPERQKLQQDLEKGLSGLGKAIKKDAQTVTSHPVSQRIKTEVEDIGERVRSGQVEARARAELVGALRSANAGLEKAASHMTGKASPASSGSTPTTEQPGTESHAQSDMDDPAMSESDPSNQTAGFDQPGSGNAREEQ